MSEVLLLHISRNKNIGCDRPVKESVCFFRKKKEQKTKAQTNTTTIKKPTEKYSCLLSEMLLVNVIMQISVGAKSKI